MPGPAVNFSHGNVDAHEPTPGALDVFIEGYKKGGCVAYTPIRFIVAVEIFAKKWLGNWLLS